MRPHGTLLITKLIKKIKMGLILCTNHISLFVFGFVPDHTWGRIIPYLHYIKIQLEEGGSGIYARCYISCLSYPELFCYIGHLFRTFPIRWPFIVAISWVVYQLSQAFIIVGPKMYCCQLSSRLGSSFFFLFFYSFVHSKGIDPMGEYFIISIWCFWYFEGLFMCQKRFGYW